MLLVRNAYVTAAAITYPPLLFLYEKGLGRPMDRLEVTGRSHSSVDRRIFMVKTSCKTLKKF